MYLKLELFESESTCRSESESEFGPETALFDNGLDLRRRRLGFSLSR